jgi:hypothetical protein
MRASYAHESFNDTKSAGEILKPSLSAEHRAAYFNGRGEVQPIALSRKLRNPSQSFRNHGSINSFGSAILNSRSTTRRLPRQHTRTTRKQNGGDREPIDDRLRIARLEEQFSALNSLMAILLATRLGKALALPPALRGQKRAFRLK